MKKSPLDIDVGQAVATRISRWLWRLRYLGREQKWLMRIVGNAKGLQQGGDEISMSCLLAEADRVANLLSCAPHLFSRCWRSIVEYQLAVYDLPSAVETARRASQAEFPDAIAVVEQIERIVSATMPWRDSINAAHFDLCHGRAQEIAGNALVIFLPSTAFGFEQENEPGMRGGLRFIFGEIIAACRENSIAYEVRGRLANHGTPQVEDGRLYISHHSVDLEGRGLHIKATDRPLCFSFDRLGYSGWSKFAATPLQELDLEGINTDAEDFIREKERIILGNVSKYQQSASDAVLSGKYVFVGLQKPGDAVQQLARMSMLEMLREVVGTCRERGIAVVVKRHPKCTSGAVARELARGVKARIYHVSNASIHDLIAGSCAVCVVNSSVGAEALLHEKPVYLFGTAEYQHVCYRMNAAGDFAKAFRPDEMPVTPEILRRFLHLLRHEYAVDLTDTENAADFIRRKVLEHADNRSRTLRAARDRPARDCGF